MAGRGPAMRGLTGQVTAIAADGSTEGASPLCCSLWRVVKVRNGSAGQSSVRQGKTRTGPARCDVTWSVHRCRRQHWGLQAPLLLSTEGSQGPVRFGGAGKGGIWSGSAWRGSAMAADGSTEPERALCCSLKEWLRFGGARLGWLRCGGALAW